MLSNYSIAVPSAELANRVQAAIDVKTKPPGSLGRIEELALKMAVSQGTESPSADPARLFLFAGDHGLAKEGVSAWPSEVTTQMVLNFLSGGAAANVFARQNNVEITVVDAGIIGDLPSGANLVSFGIRKGTRNATLENALTDAEVSECLEKAARLARDAVTEGNKVILLGEMGIGNTSSATLLAHALTGLPVAELAGPGAGLDSAGIERKIEILNAAAKRVPGILSPEEGLAAFGGLEIASMAGAAIGAASAGATVLVDGFIASTAALVASKARPELTPSLVFAHASREPGHRLVLQAIGASPLFDLEMRLGEGTGALLALPLLRCACAMLSEMATFESAGVSGKESLQ